MRRAALALALALLFGGAGVLAPRRGGVAADASPPPSRLLELRDELPTPLHREARPPPKPPPEKPPENEGRPQAQSPSKVEEAPEGGSPILACIRAWESGGGVIGQEDYGAVSPSGKHRDAYQMDRDFWLSYGGDPAYAGSEKDSSTWRWEDAPTEMQDAVAARGLAARGLQPWPTPTRKCR